MKKKYHSKKYKKKNIEKFLKKNLKFIISALVLIINIIMLLIFIVMFGTYHRTTELFFRIDLIFISTYFIYLIIKLVTDSKNSKNIYFIIPLLIYSWIIFINFRILPLFESNESVYNAFFIVLLILRLLIILACIIFNSYGRKAIMGNLKLRPDQSLVVGFLILILTGSLLLSLPISVRDNENISYLTSIFTSTSAVCVTGLIVENTPTYWTPFGQGVILALIQLGGLGFMTFTSFIAFLVGSRLNIHSQTFTLEVYGQNSFETLKYLIKMIVIGTFIIEIIGATLLFFSIDESQFGWSFGEKLYNSIFHSISAFCNAGFSLRETSLMEFSNNVGVNFAIMFLIISGGIGFTVILNLKNYINYKFKTKILNKKIPNVIISFHSKVVLSITSFLILFGTIMFLIFEWNNGVLSDNIPIKIMQSLFQSITTRTAGFNSISFDTLNPNIPALREVTFFVMILLMFIGASPGSTGGGIKTTTFFVIYSTLISTLRGYKKISAFDRRIMDETLYRAVAILFSYLVVVICAIFILMITEEFTLLQIIFEVVSAVSTVGLSANITSGLSTIGRIVIIIVMFTGRIGVLSFLYIFAKPKKERSLKYPQDSLSIG